MIVNGVTIPDIPAEVLAEYPYALIVKQTITSSVFSMTGYSGIASTSPIAVLPPNMSEYIEPPYEGFDPGEEYRFCFTEHSGVKIDRAEEDSSETWNITEMVKDYGDFGVWTADSTVTISTGEGIEGTITNETVWANHDICVATGIAEDCLAIAGTEVYFANSSTPAEPHPTRVSIGRSLVDGYAKEVQRLTGTTEQMNAIQIREKLATVKAAIKIGDTVLPPIPEDVLVQYPYVFFQYVTMTSGEETMTVYSGLCSSSKFAVIPPGMIIYDETEYADEECYNSIWTKKEGVRIFCFEGDADWEIEEIPTDEFGAWTVDHTSDLSSVGMGTMTAKIVWSNHDICVVTEMDYENGIASTVGTEVYFSERQNFNGVWLPKIPADVLAEFPYAVVMRTTFSGTSMYEFWTANSPFFLAKGTAETEWIDMLVSKGSGRNGIVENDVMNGSDFGDVIKQEQPCGDIPAYDASFIPVWANHDIYEVASDNTSTDEYIAGDLYFPPLPAIDTDRVSIGYDLCDGIVEEVQRLSGTEDKMNALRAYWKLTTVNAEP